MAKLENVDFDLNALFTLNYSFDSLRLMLENIAKNQRMFNDRITKLESVDHSTRQNNTNTNTNAYGKNNNNYPSIIEQQQQQKNESTNGHAQQSSSLKSLPNEPSSPSKRKVSHIQSNSIEQTDEDNVPQDDYNQRIKIIETKINKIYSSLSNACSKNEHYDSVEDFQNKYDVLTNKDNELTQKIADLSFALDEIKVKVSEFNVYELFKDSNTEGGSLDASKLLIQALETKIFKKFSLIDEKVKLSESEAFKAKTEVTTMKNMVDSHTRSLTTIKGDINELKTSMDSLSSNHDNRLSKLEHDLTAMNNDLMKQIKAITDDIKAINEANDLDLKETDMDKEITPIQSISGLVTEREYRKFREAVQKKLNDLERRILLCTEKSLTDQLIKEINDLQYEMKDKTSRQELYNTNDKVITLTDSLHGLKDDVCNVIDDIKKMKSDQNFLVKKFEAVQSQLLLLKTNDDYSSRNKDNSSVELSKYLEIETFNDFLKNYHKDYDRFRREQEDIRRNNDELADTLKSKATEMQLNQMEDYLLSLINDIKNNFNKKYADRIDTNKNFKSIEMQLKHIIDIYIKRSDKGDSWLLAKKPIGGHSCASCENYIGDLTDKSEYCAWNKVPGKEVMGETYRSGNGFSRILGMINFDKNAKREPAPYTEYESDNDPHQHQHTIENNKKKKLPPLDNNTNTANMKSVYTEPNADYSDGNEDRKATTQYKQKNTNNEDEPKVVKIFKVKKDKDKDKEKDSKQ